MTVDLPCHHGKWENALSACNGEPGPALVQEAAPALVSRPMAAESPLPSRETVAAMFALTAVTGLVDAVSHLRLGRVFVANMTGNIVFLGFSLSPHSGLSPVTSVVAVGGFLAGAAAGGRAGAHFEAQARRWLTTAFATEAAHHRGRRAVRRLAWCTTTDRAGTPPGSSSSSVALGVQNSTIAVSGWRTSPQRY